MSTLGKVLAVLNVLAGLGFISLAAMDYAKQHAADFAVLQGDFIIKGLPVDESETDVDGQPLVSLVGKKMEQQLFGGQGPKTQVEEVKKRQQELTSIVDQAGDEKAKRDKLEAILLPLARTEGERDDLRRHINTDKIDDLMADSGPFQGAFKEAATGRSLSGQELDLDQRRGAIAHLLINLGEKSDTYLQRVAVVVGVTAYAREVELQATSFEEMVPVVVSDIAAQRQAFAAKYDALIQQIVALRNRLQEVQEGLDKQQRLLEEHTKVVNNRTQEIKDIKEEIDRVKQATVVAVGEQSGLEKELFEATNKVRDLTHQNERLVGEIKKHETAQ